MIQIGPFNHPNNSELNSLGRSSYPSDRLITEYQEPANALSRKTDRQSQPWLPELAGGCKSGRQHLSLIGKIPPLGLGAQQDGTNDYA